MPNHVSSHLALPCCGWRPRSTDHAALANAIDHGTNNPSAAPAMLGNDSRPESPKERCSACSAITFQNLGCACCTQIGHGNASAQNTRSAGTRCSHEPAGRARRTNNAAVTGASANHSATGPFVIAAAASNTAAASNEANAPERTQRMP